MYRPSHQTTWGHLKHGSVMYSFYERMDWEECYLPGKARKELLAWCAAQELKFTESITSCGTFLH